MCIVWALHLLVVINCGISGFDNWPIGHYLITCNKGRGGGPERVNVSVVSVLFMD